MNIIVKMKIIKQGIIIIMINKQPIDMTFVVPVYNAEKYLAECLTSLLNQNISKEILCINDGSTDNSLVILQQYAENYAEIRIINQNNEGVSKARNIGIAQAKGRYIWLVDSDDCILVENMSELIELADNHQVDLVRGLIIRQDEQGKANILAAASDLIVEKYRSNEKFAAPMTGSQYLLGSINKGFTPKITAGLYRTSFLQQNQCYFPNSPISNAEDEYFEMLVFTRSLPIKLFEVSMPFYFYRHNQTSSTKSRQKQLEGSLAVFSLLLNLCDQLENQLAQLELSEQDYIDAQKLLWAVRFITLRLNCIACVDLYLKLTNEQQLSIQHLINATNIHYLDEFKYMILSCENNGYYIQRYTGFTNNINLSKALLKDRLNNS